MKSGNEYIEPHMKLEDSSTLQTANAAIPVYQRAKRFTFRCCETMLFDPRSAAHRNKRGERNVSKETPQRYSYNEGCAGVVRK